MVRRHLDLGCGSKPRNPYNCAELYGVDIRDGLSAPGVVRIVAANLSLQPIPFADGYFDSVSAYDFLEHLPRVAIDYAKAETHFPFVELMNEVFRVLKPGGTFYAVTPAYPHAKAFCDPTHVNFISKKSHEYFTAPDLSGRMYGFTGNFSLVRNKRIHFRRRAYEPLKMSISGSAQYFVDRLLGKQSHLVWEFRASK